MQLRGDYKYLGAPDTPAAAAAAGSPAPAGAALAYTKRKGLCNIEDDCDHATWVDLRFHFEPGEGVFGLGCSTRNN